MLKERKIQILKMLISALSIYSEGYICNELLKLFNKGKIKIEEHNIMMQLIKDNVPKGKLVGAAWWECGEVIPRFEFLKKLIRDLEKEEVQIKPKKDFILLGYRIFLFLTLILSVSASAIYLVNLRTFEGIVFFFIVILISCLIYKTLKNEWR